jgi:hypothetical protein
MVAQDLKKIRHGFPPFSVLLPPFPPLPLSAALVLNSTVFDFTLLSLIKFKIFSLLKD